MTSTRSSGALRWAPDGRTSVRAVAFIALVAILVAEGRAAGGRSDVQTQDAGALVLLVLASAALLLRERWPMAVMVAVTSGAYIWWHLIDYDSRAMNVPYLVALYSASLHGSARRTTAIGIGLATASGVALVAFGGGFAVQRWLTGMGWTIAALLFGETVRNRAELADAAEQRARRAEAESDRRLVEERLHIARELHDVLAHTVSVMSIQAKVAADSLDRDRTTVEASLAAIRRAGRDAMGEVRATVSVLRSAGEDSGRVAPAPRLDRIGDVVLVAREQGVDVAVDVELSGQALPEVMELTIYRVVQEAITNVIRHADASHATVSIHEGQQAVTVEIRDDGHRTCGSVGAGFGLRGMAERVESVGGQLWHGYDGDSGWVVRACLPVGACEASGANSSGLPRRV